MTEPVDNTTRPYQRPSRADLEARAHDIEAQVRATNDKINARTGRPIFLAIGVGVALGAALLVSLLIVKWLFVIFAGALVIVASLELATALRVSGRVVPRAAVVIGAVLVVPGSFFAIDASRGLSNEAGHWLFSIAAVLIVVVWRLAQQLVSSQRAASSSLTDDLGAGAFVVLYTIFLPSFFVLLVAQENGQWWTLAALIIVVSVDTGAYASGLAFGKNKMVPSISPNKTWEGFAGSVAAAVVAGILLALFMLQQPWWVGIIIGLTIVLTATVGDLTESLIKRDLGVKDISTWLPGHGGLLDRLDSALPSAAAAYALFIIFT